MGGERLPWLTTQPLLTHVMFRMQPNFYTSLVVDTWNFYVGVGYFGSGVQTDECPTLSKLTRHHKHSGPLNR
jgi:hypothetical protein